MMTFEEALLSITQTNAGVPDDILREGQTEFGRDISTSEFCHVLAQNITTHFLCQDFDTHEALQQALETLYLNGLMLGVAVGVRMEKAE